MTPRLREASYLQDYRVRLVFSDGVKGDLDLEGELWGEVFEPLKDKSLFSQLRLDSELETIVWPNGADFAPEFLYEKLRPSPAIKPTCASRRD